MKQQLLEEFDKQFTTDVLNDEPFLKTIIDGLMLKVRTFLSTTYDKAYAKGREDERRLRQSECGCHCSMCDDAKYGIDGCSHCGNDKCGKPTLLNKENE